MPYQETKVYFDGSHYIAIPYYPNKTKKRPKPPEEIITVTDEDAATTVTDAAESEEKEQAVNYSPKEEKPPTERKSEGGKRVRKMTKKELFEELYDKTKDMRRAARKEYIAKAMRPYFKSDTDANYYVTCEIDRKIRNLICRRQRLVRKVNLQEFNYFCTFTYDSEKHTEEGFRNKFKHTISNFAKRKGWKYVGVWERSPEKKRLHFHGLFYIPEGTLPGALIQVEDYNFNTKRRQITNQSLYFNERFGRSDFELIDSPYRIGDAIAYLMKYLEKSGEKIVYSRGLPQYFISDILDDDVVCPFGQEDKKLLLFDDFICLDQGCYIGPVSKEVIAQMPKSN